MGNDAIHELAAPEPRKIVLAIKIIEDLLNFFYELDYKASQLQETQIAAAAVPLPGAPTIVTLARSGRVISSGPYIRNSGYLGTTSETRSAAALSPGATGEDVPNT